MRREKAPEERLGDILEATAAVGRYQAETAFTPNTVAFVSGTRLDSPG